MPEPRIHTYYSSRTEDLLESLLFQLENDTDSPVNSPFGRAQILVPNSGMQRYLELKIAQRFGICSHIDIDYAGQFVAATYKQLLDNESPAHLDERLLTFALLHLWDKQQLPLDSHFSRLFQQHSQARQRYFFAQKIAKLFRRYLSERPGMIDRWQAGKLATDHPHEAWQRDSFQQLLSSLAITHTSRWDLQQRFVTALDNLANGANSTALTGKWSLPSIVHVFGFHAVPTAQLTDLLALGQATQVVFYTFNPCVAYWQDIVPEKVKTRAEITREAEAELLSVGHPLLASWGQSGQYYIDQLNDYPNNNLEDMIAPTAPHSVLTWLQHDIRELSDTRVDVATLFRQETAPSISLHACANPRREVEVLYDNLCRAFENSDLNPANVLVIVPKLSDYAAHIQAIFSRTAKVQHAIPYSLANQSSAETDPDVQAFLSLLDVLDSDFQAQTLFECLGEARIQDALHISQSHLDSLRHWFVDSRYSLHFYDSGGGENSSLEKLLDSLLLASVGGDNAELGKRRASSLYHGGQDATLTQLCELWQRFLPFVGLKKQRLTLSDWLAQLRRLSDAFLPPRHAMEAWLNDWYETLTALGDHCECDFATVRADLSAVLQSDTLHGPFLSGGVSFCAVVPMRSIPAKMIAVLGLNSDFPAISAKDPLDLCLSRSLWSDRNPHKEQQYFFLETLMAARERLYLSHVGLDEKTGDDIPPSALVRELFGYLERQLPAALPFTALVTRKYPLQGFVAEDSYQMLYNTPNARELSRELPNDGERHTVTLPDSLTATQLADCLLEPLSAYWRYHLGAEPLDALNEPLAEHEFIAADSGLDTWQYRQTALLTALSHANHSDHSEDHDDNNGIANLQQRNWYAPHVISTAMLDAANDATRPLFDVLSTLDLINPPKEINTHYKQPFADSHIYLRLRAERYPHGLLSYHVGKLDAKKLLRAWVKHVLYHSLPDAEPCRSQLLTLDNSKGKACETTFAPFADKNAAQSALSQLLTLAQSVIHHPYPMVLKISPKKAETTLHYEVQNDPLYSPILTADESLVRELQAQWAVVDRAIETNTR